MSNMLNESLAKLVKGYWALEKKTKEARAIMVDCLISEGFQLKTDFAFTSAKNAGRATYFEMVKAIAHSMFPQAVQDALAVPLAGKAMIKIKGKQALPLDHWKTAVPAKIRSIKEAWEAETRDRARNEKAETARLARVAALAAGEPVPKVEKVTRTKHLAIRCQKAISPLLAACRNDDIGPMQLGGKLNAETLSLLAQIIDLQKAVHDQAVRDDDAALSE